MEREIVYCQECGYQRQYFVSGAVCPNGHGKLYAMPLQDFNYYQEKVEMDELPIAVKVKGRWTVDGKKYVRAKPDEAELTVKGGFIDGMRKIHLKEAKVGSTVKS